jgi:hypothetical protein
MSEKRLKSAYELAIERLRSKDREQGVQERAPLDDRQRREIADLRTRSKARLAELEILRDKDLAASGGDPARMEEIDSGYRRDRARIESDLETAIERVRAGKPGRIED